MFIVRQCYNESSFFPKIADLPDMKVRVLSDLHLDLNEGYVLPPSPDDCLTLIMGDISGYFSFYEDLVPTIKKG